MKGFAFRLQKVLNLRAHSEDEAKIELGRAITALSEIENSLLAIGQERVAAAAEQFKAANSSEMIRQYMFYILKLDTTKEELLKEAAAAELQVEQARQVFLQASQERKVLDKLKEKQEKAYRKETLLQEAKVLDDVRLDERGGE
ncbi:MAG: flagellar export protein FliJ [Treponema sp.]|nr:flagellar export protein FliJ [Treponema sp.]